MSISTILRPRRVAHAHCDLPCGVYDPAQARIEAESVKAIQEMFQDASKRKEVGSQSETEWGVRALKIKEERADLVKHHLWVLWTDYFKPNHLDDHPRLHDLFWRATKAASEAKRSIDPTQGEQLLQLVKEIDQIFWDTKE